MAKIKLGITPGELMGMLPGLMKEAWASYADDKQVTADEGVMLAAAILRKMGEASDPPQVKSFFLSQADAFVELAPLLEEDDE